MLAEATEAVPGLASYGGVGLLALGAIWLVRILITREQASLDRERASLVRSEARADRLEEEVRRLNKDIHEQFVPALTKATDVMSQMLTKSRRPT